MWAIIDVYGNTLAIQLSNFVQDSNEEVTAGQNGLIHSDSLSPDGKTWLHFIIQLWGAKNKFVTKGRFNKIKVKSTKKWHSNPSKS